MTDSKKKKKEDRCENVRKEHNNSRSTNKKKNNNSNIIGKGDTYGTSRDDCCTTDFVFICFYHIFFFVHLYISFLLLDVFVMMKREPED